MLREELYDKNGIPEYLDKLGETLMNHRNIALFGGGLGGVNTLQWIKDNVPDAIRNIRCILDNNPLKWGTHLSSIEIVKPEPDVLRDLSLLAITCGEGDVIKDQLEELGLSDSTEVIIPDISVIDRAGKDFEYIQEHMAELEAVYSMLFDDKSQKVYRNLLNFRINHDMSLIGEIYDPFERQYFDEELINYNADDVFVDCGSYIGDTIEYYKKWSGNKFGKVYAVEADKDNFDILTDKYRTDSRILPVNCGLWDEKTELKFDDIGSGSGTISEKGKKVIHADTIDDVVSMGKVDFIKMDIEGAEYNALVGARHTIDKYTPTLMISVYHKREDLIKIPLFIKSICPEYKIFMRHYRKLSVQETICYAIR